MFNSVKTRFRKVKENPKETAGTIFWSSVYFVGKTLTAEETEEQRIRRIVREEMDYR